MKSTIVVVLLSLAGFLFACQSEPDNAAELLLGRWEIQNAYRNGQDTQTLEGLFFEFYEDGLMKTNLPISAKESSYTLDDGVIEQGGVDEPLQFEIVTMTDSTLTLGSTIRSYDFRFVLNKRIPVN